MRSQRQSETIVDMGVPISINLSETGRSSRRRRQVVHEVERVARPV